MRQLFIYLLGANVEPEFDDATLAAAWDEFERCPTSRRAKSVLADGLAARPTALTFTRASLFLRLLRDPDIDPNQLSRTGWQHLLRETEVFAAWPTAVEPVARRLEEHEHARALLTAAPVNDYGAEKRLTQVRRWVLLSDRWREYPQLTRALHRQAELNGGAWLIEDDELEVLKANREQLIAYEPRSIVVSPASGGDDPVTRAVAAQYEQWPYPQWTRVLARPPRSLAAEVRDWDPTGPDTLPSNPEILIAGCGTGKHAASFALKYPDARITAIDISGASLRVAKARCADLGISAIDFRLLDLHRLAELGRRFDAISCVGVLHHLPDPGAGWAVLVNALNPAGLLHLGVYSTLGRLSVQRLRAAVGELPDGNLDSGVLRQIRRRVIERFPDTIPTWSDFFTLSGVHDLLAHRHEEPFDVSRIRGALDTFNLALLRFQISRPDARAEYLREYPHDRNFRDVASWAAFEKRHPHTFSSMYRFWCRRRC